MYEGFQLSGSTQPIAVGEHLIKGGRRHLVVLLPDGAWVTSLPGAPRFRLMAGRLAVATTVWSHAVYPVVSFWLFYFRGSLGCLCWLHAAHRSLCAARLGVAAGCMLLTVCRLLSAAGHRVADRFAPCHADSDCLTIM